MTEPPPCAWLRADGRSLAWGLVIAFMGKLAAATGSAAVLAGWQVLFLFVLPLAMPLRYLVAAILATVVFFDASLWFRQGAEAVRTVYEAPGAWIKPPEWLFAALALRLAVLRDLPASLPGPMKLLAGTFAAICLLGGATALLRGTALRDVLIYSELRSPLVMVAGLWLLAPLVRANPRFFIDSLGGFVLAHFAVSLLSWAGGISLLWESHAANYAGTTAAFFGGDETVMVYLLVQAIALAMAMAPRAGRLSRHGRLFWWLVLAATSFAILASLRRGGVMASGIVLAHILVFAGLRGKLRLGALLLLALVPVGLVAAQLGLTEALLDRFSGAGRVAVSDLGRAADVAQARDHLARHFWFGTGAGTRLALVRTQAYGVAEALSIHHAVYHVWVRFGAFGALSYTLLFLAPVGGALAALRQGGAFRPLANAMSGLLLALFIWGLYVPAIFLNFRQAGVWIIAVALICALPRTAAPAPADGLRAEA